MGIAYTNRQGKTYHLQHGTDSRGKERYWFGQKITGNVVTELPFGYEIHEKPDSAQVFLRRIEPTVILPEELAQARAALLAHLGAGMARVNLEGKGLREIVVYVTDADVDARLSLMHAAVPGSISEDDSFRAFMLRTRRFDKLLRFTLVDPVKRHFSAERWCFRGSIDKWITLRWGPMHAPHRGEPDAPLGTQLSRYVCHLGRESFFELM